jgi:hypothetical protein
MSGPDLIRSVRIRCLVLEGLDPGDRGAVVTGLRRELARLMAEDPPGRATEAHRQPPWNGSPADLGRFIAAQVHARVEGR